jgi:hypothetical protein
MSDDISTLQPTTELEAVNAMLDSIGEQPITSLIDIEAADAGTALRRLTQTSKSVQQIGWHWNTDEDVSIAPNGEGELVLPSNTLKVVRSPYESTPLVQRGLRLYDPKNHTYTFTKPYKATLVVALPFEEMPEAARQYVMLKATEIFQQGALGNVQLDQFAKDAMKEAMANLQAAESEAGGHNILYGSWDVFRVINRASW